MVYGSILAQSQHSLHIELASDETNPSCTGLHACICTGLLACLISLCLISQLALLCKNTQNQDEPC